MAKVLLVDDEALIRKVVRTVLEAEGHEVVEASDGFSAMDQLRVHEPDIVVLDLMMPGEEGTVTCRKIKAAAERTRVLVLTAVASAEAEAEAAGAGADDFIAKPFSSLDLLLRVTMLMER